MTKIKKISKISLTLGKRCVLLYFCKNAFLKYKSNPLNIHNTSLHTQEKSGFEPLDVLNNDFFFFFYSII